MSTADTMSVYDPEDDAFVDVEVISSSGPEVVRRSETDDRHYPGEDLMARTYEVRLPDGTPWTATATWTGESNEHDAYIVLDES